MLKIYIYGYLNRVPSSRRPERECQRNVELMRLTGRLAPDFRTIADFRHDSGPAIRNVCRRFVELCRGLTLLSSDMVAIDGSEFKAVNSRDRNYTAGKIGKRQQQIEESVQRYLDMIETADRISPTGFDVKTMRLYEKIALLRQRMRQLGQIKKRLKNEPDEPVAQRAALLRQTHRTYATACGSRWCHIESCGSPQTGNFPSSFLRCFFQQ